MKTLKKQKKGTVTLSRNEAKAAYHGRMTKDGMDFSWENVATLATELSQLAEEIRLYED